MQRFYLIRPSSEKVCVWIEEISEGLRCDDHARHRPFDRRELRGEELCSNTDISKGLTTL